MRQKIDSRMISLESRPGIYWDTELPGFAVKVMASGRKKYIAETKLRGTRRNVRVTIGDTSVVSLKQARDIAREQLFAIGTKGVDTNAERKVARMKEEAERSKREVTLRHAIDDYIKDRALKPLSVKHYVEISERCMSDWMDMPLAAIDKFMVERRYEELKGKPGQANICMRLLGAVFNWATEKYIDSCGQPLVRENPVMRLSRLRKWVTLMRRQDVLTDDLLKIWFQAVTELPNTTLRDLFLLLLHTGLRRNEGAALTYDDCNFEMRTITIDTSKNGRKHIIPMSDYVYELLSARKKERNVLTRYVFPNSTRTGHIRGTSAATLNVKRSMAKQLGFDYDKADETERRRVHWMIHGLRRTFITIADRLGIPHYTLKRLVNHSTASDVTSGYVIVQADRMRQPMQEIADFINGCVSATSGSESTAQTS